MGPPPACSHFKLSTASVEPLESRGTLATTLLFLVVSPRGYTAQGNASQSLIDPGQAASTPSADVLEMQTLGPTQATERDTQAG